MKYCHVQGNASLNRVLLFCIGRGSVCTAFKLGRGSVCTALKLGRGSVLAALKKQMISTNGEPGNGDVAPPVTTLHCSVTHYSPGKHRD